MSHDTPKDAICPIRNNYRHNDFNNGIVSQEVEPSLCVRDKCAWWASDLKAERMEPGTNNPIWEETGTGRCAVLDISFNLSRIGDQHER